jgi:hypothetical protein
MRAVRAKLRLNRNTFGLLTRAGGLNVMNYERQAARWPAKRLAVALPAILADCDQLEKDLREVRAIVAGLREETHPRLLNK